MVCGAAAQDKDVLLVADMRWDAPCPAPRWLLASYSADSGSVAACQECSLEWLALGLDGARRHSWRLRG